jgi:hypothetical protein
MVAFVVLLITMLPLGYLVTSEVHQAATAKDRLAALGVAEKWVEILGTAQDPPTNLDTSPKGSLGVDTGEPLIPVLPNGTSVPTETRGGTVFTIRAEYDWTGTQDANTAPDLCSSGGAQVLNLQVTVTWGRAQQVTDTTILDYPPPGIPMDGFYQLQLAGATGASDVGWNSWSSRVQAIPVTFTEITPTPYVNPPIYPDQYGCVFAELIPGTYTVSVKDPSAGTPTGTSYGSPSFVENLGTDGNPIEPKSLFVANANPVTPVTIAPGVTTPLTTLYYDEGSTVGLSYPSSTSTADGVTCPGIGQITCVSEGEGTTGSQGWPNPPNATLAWTSGSTWSSAVMPSSPSSTRIASVACATAACIGVGYGLTGTGPQGVIIADSTTTQPGAGNTTIPAGTVTADAIPTNLVCPSSTPCVASLTNVICPTPTACVAWGTLSTPGLPSTTGLPVVLAGTISSSGDTWSQVTLPSGPTNTMATLNQVACTPDLNCVAVGSATPGDLWGWAASGPLFVAGTGGTWFAPPVPSTVLGNPPNLTQVACPSAGHCMAIGTGQIMKIINGLPVLTGGLPVWGPTIPIVVSALFDPGTPGTIAWTPVLPSVEPSSFSQLVCPPSNPSNPSNTCLAVGTYGGQAVIYSGTAGSEGSTGSIDLPILVLRVDYSVPNAPSSLSQVTCPSSPSSTVCVAIGSSSTGPVILSSGAIGTTDTWSANSIPTGITSVSAVSCSNTTSPNPPTCAIAASCPIPNTTTCSASTTTPSTPAAAILSGSPGSSATWSPVSPLPSALYLTGISCTPTGGTSSTCSAVGASPSGAVIMTSVTGPGGTWNDHTSDRLLKLTGSPTSNIPIELTGGGLQNTSGSNGWWNPVLNTKTGSPIIANTTSILDIFPFAAGYGVSAGDCPNEDVVGGAGSAVAATVPGNTAASPGVIVPLAVLAIQVNSPAGAPELGDLLTLTATTSGTVGSPCAPDTYTLQPTGPDGLSRTEVPFGSYSLKVGSSSTTSTVVVAPGVVTVGSTVYTLPQTPMVTGP